MSSSSIHACSCLNVKVRAQIAPTPTTPTGTPQHSPTTAAAPPPLTTTSPALEESDELASPTSPLQQFRGHLPYVQAAPTVGGYQAKLGLGGITIEHRLLVKHILHEEHWLEVRCMNCSCAAYYIHLDPALHYSLPELNAQIPYDGTVLLGTETITDIQQAKQSPTFSEACKIILMSNHAKAEHTPEEYGLAQAYEAFDAGIKRSLEYKRIQMEERIAAYRREQQELLEHQQQRIMRDAEILWAQVCNLHRDRLHRHQSAAGGSGSATVRTSAPRGAWATPTSPDSVGSPSFANIDAATVGSFYQRSYIASHPVPPTGRRRSMVGVADLNKRPTDAPSPASQLSSSIAAADSTADTAPAPDASTSELATKSKGSDTPNSVRRVRFGGETSAPTDENSPPSAVEPAMSPEHSQSDDAIFDLDEEEESTDKYHQDSLSESEEEDQPPASPTQAPEPMPSYSSSLPIRIPSMSRLNTISQPTIPEEGEISGSPPKQTGDDVASSITKKGSENGGSDDEEDNDRFVAPHILSARTYTEDYFSAMRPPKARKTSFAI
ncbi:hypothetical protein PhCBS80983_g05742 [Powellomyces hirtus]|uniref:Uncharacterized protein n=1 Tax=Powellomyces hirtus TaxID=109895 RepID=A0A507DV20_9FUNG|nr:hypothetical protein PhCBS80983_g05742 [Powellomyces hirtus]